MDQDKAHLGQSAPPRTQLPVTHPRVFPFLPPAPPHSDSAFGVVSAALLSSRPPSLGSFSFPLPWCRELLVLT